MKAESLLEATRIRSRATPSGTSPAALAEAWHAVQRICASMGWDVGEVAREAGVRAAPEDGAAAARVAEEVRRRVDAARWALVRANPRHPAALRLVALARRLRRQPTITDMGNPPVDGEAFGSADLPAEPAAERGQLRPSSSSAMRLCQYSGRSGWSGNILSFTHRSRVQRAVLTKARARAVLLATVVVVVWAVPAQTQPGADTIRVYELLPPVLQPYHQPELPFDYPLDVHDGSLADWARALPAPSLDQSDFALVGQPGTPPHPADLSLRVYLGYTYAQRRLYVAVEMADNVHVGAPVDSTVHGAGAQDAILLMVDGDHSGGQYDGFSADVYGEWQAKLLSGFQAQRYVVVPAAPDGVLLASGSAAGWTARPPWGDAGGHWGSGAMVELYVTPWRELFWDAPESSDVDFDALRAGRPIGFQMVVQDVDTVGAAPRLYSIGGASTVMTTADDFVDALPVRCCGEWCSWVCAGDVCMGDHDGPCWGTAVSPASWATAKRACAKAPDLLGR